MANIREDIRQAANEWSWNHKDAHPVDLFEAGVLWSEETLSTREKRCEEIEQENVRLEELVNTKRKKFSETFTIALERTNKLKEAEEENKRLKDKYEELKKFFDQNTSDTIDLGDKLRDQAQEIERLTLLKNEYGDNAKKYLDLSDAKDRELSELRASKNEWIHSHGEVTAERDDLKASNKALREALQEVKHTLEYAEELREKYPQAPIQQFHFNNSISRITAALSTSPVETKIEK